MRVSRRLRRAKIKKCQPETLRLQLTTPSRRRLRRCRRGCCTEARRRRPARGPAPFPARGWGRCQLGQTPQLSPLRGLSFKRAFKCKKRATRIRKTCVSVLISDAAVTATGCRVWRRPSRRVECFFSFPLTCVRATTPRLCCRRQERAAEDAAARHQRRRSRDSGLYLFILL